MNEKHEAGDLSALDAILEEVRLAREAGELAPAETPEEPANREWSMDEIDRLIAQTVGEDYEPSVAAEPWIPETSAEKRDVFTAASEPVPAEEPSEAAPETETNE